MNETKETLERAVREFAQNYWYAQSSSQRIGTDNTMKEFINSIDPKNKDIWYQKYQEYKTIYQSTV